MKKIVILRCLRSEENCTGAACLSAFNHKKGQFEQYGNDELELLAFMSCNGCNKLNFADKAGLEEKIERILKIKPDVVHVGICCKTRTDNNEYCSDILELVEIFKKSGINIVWGTHSGAVRHKYRKNDIIDK